MNNVKPGDRGVQRGVEHEKLLVTYSDGEKLAAVATQADGAVLILRMHPSDFIVEQTWDENKYGKASGELVVCKIEGTGKLVVFLRSMLTHAEPEESTNEK
jgi:hypothetical protein